MRKSALILVFTLISVSFGATPFDMGSCDYTYNISGGFVMDKVTSYEITISAVPDNCELDTEMKISEGNREAIISGEGDSPLVWSFACDFQTSKELLFFGDLDTFPQEYNSPYLAFGYYPDYSPEISEQASLVVEGSRTVLEAGMRIAKWVHENVEYSREYDLVYEDQKGRASQVFESRKGVCDEFSTLFISMARSVGIPARYVSGLAYSDIYGGHGMHAWAEFFAGQWVPVDLTFGEFGVLDASHIALERSFDGNFTPISMSWTGYGGSQLSSFNPFENQPNSVSGPRGFSIFLDYHCAQEEALFPLEVEIDREHISDNDYTLVSAEFTNPHNSYIPLPVRFTRVESLELVHGSYEDLVVLSPMAKTTKKYLVHVKDLDNRYTYSLPLKIDADFATNWSRTIFVNPRSESKPLSYYMQNISWGDEMHPGLEILNFYFEPNPTYTETTQLVFSLKNTGNQIIEPGLELFYDGHREDFEIGRVMINEVATRNLTINVGEVGEFHAGLRLYSGNISLYREGLLIRAQEPSMVLAYEGEQEFTSEDIRFNISGKDCYSGSIFLMTGIAGIRYDYGESSFEPPPEIFFPGKNVLNISLMCVDAYGEQFFNSTSVEILVDVEGIDYIVWLLKSVFRRIINFFEPKLL